MGLKFPPIPKAYLNTDITVIKLVNGEDGTTESEMFKGKCVFDEKSRTKVTADRQIITLNGLAIIQGDINQGEDIKGYVHVNSVKRHIESFKRIRNLDGTVHHVELDLK